MAREWSSVPVLDIRDFLDAVIFAALTGNADARSKIVSFGKGNCNTTENTNLDCPGTRSTPVAARVRWTGVEDESSGSTLVEFPFS